MTAFCEDTKNERKAPIDLNLWPERKPVLLLCCQHTSLPSHLVGHVGDRASGKSGQFGFWKQWPIGVPKEAPGQNNGTLDFAKKRNNGTLEFGKAKELWAD